MTPAEFQEWFQGLTPSDRSRALTIARDMFFRDAGNDLRAECAERFESLYGNGGTKVPTEEEKKGFREAFRVRSGEAYRDLKDLVVLYRSKGMTYGDIGHRTGLTAMESTDVLNDALRDP